MHRQLRRFTSTRTRWNDRLLVYPGNRSSSVSLQLNDEVIRFDNIWLRDACPCAQCVDPSTRQKLFSTPQIPRLVSASFVNLTDDEGVEVVWEPGRHKSTYPLEFIKRHQSPAHAAQAHHTPILPKIWDRRIMKANVLWIDYEAYLTDVSILHTAIAHLQRYGLVFLRNIPPEDENAVEAIGNQIGYLQNTFYGKTWDVQSIENPKNIAYTSGDLGLHMDLLYYESPPGIQLLHCLRNSVQGGESVFVDAFAVAQELRRTYGRHVWNSLIHEPVSFHYENDGRHYYMERPTIVLEKGPQFPEGTISHINYSPPFQAPFSNFDASTGQNAQFRAQMLALKYFEDKVKNPTSQFTYRLQPGECVVFQNRRVLHGRTAFQHGGQRRLKGAYVDMDTFKSQCRVLQNRFGPLSRPM